MASRPITSWQIDGEKVEAVTDFIFLGSKITVAMTAEHHIAFIYVETEKGGVTVNLKNEPVAEICVCKDKPVAVYEYCNLHGLWKKDL